MLVLSKKEACCTLAGVSLYQSREQRASQSMDDSPLLFSPCIFFKVDSEFEEVATQLLKRTHAMLNKYRSLLLEDAMVNMCFPAWLPAQLSQPQGTEKERPRTSHPGHSL